MYADWQARMSRRAVGRATDSRGREGNWGLFQAVQPLGTLHAFMGDMSLNHEKVGKACQGETGTVMQLAAQDITQLAAHP